MHCASKPRGSCRDHSRRAPPTRGSRTTNRQTHHAPHGLDEASALAAARIEVGMERVDFTVKTPDAGHWEGRYYVHDLPTGQMSKEWLDPRSASRA
jgi:hypothetical protein